jgi:hypothetical protein
MPRTKKTPRVQAAPADDLSPFALQHLDLDVLVMPDGERMRVNAAESPLVWLARRKGRDGVALIAPDQLRAGERLRADFTRAQLMPRVTSNWSASAAPMRGAGSTPANPADSVIAARQCVRLALEAVGPEFSDLLLDVCCFLKGLDEVERDRRWPARSAKIVLQLGLDRLARHYGLGKAMRGRAHAPIRAWTAPESLVEPES